MDGVPGGVAEEIAGGVKRKGSGLAFGHLVGNRVWLDDIVIWPTAKLQYRKPDPNIVAYQMSKCQA